LRINFPLSVLKAEGMSLETTKTGSSVARPVRKLRSEEAREAHDRRAVPRAQEFRKTVDELQVRLYAAA